MLIQAVHGPCYVFNTYIQSVGPLAQTSGSVTFRTLPTHKSVVTANRFSYKFQQSSLQQQFRFSALIQL